MSVLPEIPNMKSTEEKSPFFPVSLETEVVIEAGQEDCASGAHPLPELLRGDLNGL